MKKLYQRLSIVLAVLMLLACVPNAGLYEKAEAASKYSIVYHKNFGNDATYTKTYAYNTNITLERTCRYSRSGYTFVGWATSPNGNVAYAPGASFRTPFNQHVSTSRALYAVWVKNLTTKDGKTVKIDSYNKNCSVSKVTATGITSRVKKGNSTTTYNNTYMGPSAGSVTYTIPRGFVSKQVYSGSYIAQCHTWAFLSLLGVSESNRAKYSISPSNLGTTFSAYKVGSYSETSGGVSLKPGDVLYSGTHSAIYVGTAYNGQKPVALVEGINNDGTRGVTLSTYSNAFNGSSTTVTVYRK